ncbi:hypothetical protein K466DRAFT_656762 [Polyporus arcularius HHB13444]|uniref:Uncharacterized protein n=1 Tax=Polyporus arcularius HHB13444 TaxID=1314778 RepID=A0A5C3NS85_9APHY|nr:hypothetical protein K466DRAFT_656762 [Polyporus arcularius HHB13444]
MHLRAHTKAGRPGRISRCSMHAELLRPLTVKPAKSDYATGCGEELGYLRALLNAMIARETGVPHARMAWTARSFQQRIFLRFGMKAVGWPPEIIFRNPKYLSMDDVRLLIELCHSGELYFTAASEDELAAGERDVARSCPGALFPAPTPALGRSDIGRQQVQRDAEGNVEPRRYERNGPKSAKWVDEEEAETTGSPTASGPRPMMYKNRTWLAWHEPGGWREATDADVSARSRRNNRPPHSHDTTSNPLSQETPPCPPPPPSESRSSTFGYSILITLYTTYMTALRHTVRTKIEDSGKRRHPIRESRTRGDQPTASDEKSSPSLELAVSLLLASCCPPPAAVDFCSSLAVTQHHTRPATRKRWLDTRASMLLVCHDSSCTADASPSPGVPSSPPSDSVYLLTIAGAWVPLRLRLPVFKFPRPLAAQCSAASYERPWTLRRVR